MIKVLVATDDSVLERMLTVTLTINGLTVESVNMMSELVTSLGKKDVHILLLDQVYEDLIPAIRAKGFNIPILSFGTQTLTDIENVNYIAKPFNFVELKTAMNTIFYKQRTSLEKELVFGDVKVDLAKSMITVKNKMVKLGKMELAIFVSLMKKAGKIVSREKMMRDLQDQGHFFNATIFQHMKELKNKINEIAEDKLIIRGIAGEGYLLVIK
jgi:DNA-binding response OmpR family regulator